MTATGLTSPRVRRRLAWSGALLLAAGGIAALVVLTSSRPAEPTGAGAAPAAPAHTAPPRAVRPPRTQLNALLDAFVPQVLGRRDLAAGRALVTPDARGSRGEWLRGVTPFQRYTARGSRFHGWTVNYSYSGDVGSTCTSPRRTRVRSRWRSAERRSGSAAAG